MNYDLETVKILNKDVERVQRQLELAIGTARAKGASWEAIGKTLGLSKQTTFNRYKNLETPKNEVQEHHEQTVKFLDGQAPAKTN